MVYLRKAVKWVWGLALHCAKEMKHDHAPQMAAAMTYRTIFSLIPMVVLGLVLLRAAMPMEKVQALMETKAFEFVGLNSLALPTAEETEDESSVGTGATATIDDAPSTDDTASQTAPTSAPVPHDNAANVRAAVRANNQMKSNLATIISGLTNKVASVSLPSIGIVGFILFIWAALAMAISVEQAFNQIYNAPHGRPWRTRIPIYWAVITIGPLMGVLSVSFSSTPLEYINEFAHTAGAGWMSGVVTRTIALAISWGLLFFAYLLMPNTPVDRKAALIGSGVTAVAWVCLKVGFGYYVTRAVPFSALYGTLALFPLFLFWLYCTWMVVLFGLELTYTLQSSKSGRLKHLLARTARDALFDPRRVVTLMTILGREFTVGKSVERSRLVGLLHVPDATLNAVITHLEAQRLIYRVIPGTIKSTDETHYTLARPPEQIRLADLIAVGQNITDGSHPPAKEANDPSEIFIQQLVKAEQNSAGDATLASLLQAPKIA